MHSHPHELNIPETLFRHCLSNSLAPAWISDENARMIFINEVAGKIWNIPADYAGKTIHQLFPKTAADNFLESDRQVLMSGRPIEAVVPSLRQDGTQGFYMLHKFLIDLENVKYISGQAIDITEEKNLEKQLSVYKVQEQRKISQAIIKAQEKERNSIAVQLQDSVNQVLATAAIMLEHTKNLSADDKEKSIQKSHNYIIKAINEIRSISGSLNTNILTDIGLREPVTDLLDTLMLSISCEVDFIITPGVETAIPAVVRQLIYRIIQTQVNNIIAHSSCTDVLLKIAANDNWAFLTISHNGSGADLNQSQMGKGLSSIKHNVESFNGDMEIITAPGNGFTLMVSLPLPAKIIYHQPAREVGSIY